MPLPEALLHSLEGLPGYDPRSFVDVHSNLEFPVSIRLNSFKQSAEKAAANLPLKARVPWTEDGYYLESRPSFTFDPIFHAGGYYVQEASSMLLEAAFRQLMPIDEPLRVLDLCAAPGGKTTHLLSLLSAESFLVSNEVIRNRAQILRQNVMKWGYPNVLVSQQDPSRFSALNKYFDLVVVDAPCSGSGLFRRDPSAISEWSESAVTLCSQRQQRILADILPSLKEGGWLFYSTCSYSQQEDEDIVQWLMREYGMHPLPLQLDTSWSMIETKYGTRCWPDKTVGEGFFLCCLQKTGTRVPNASLTAAKLSNKMQKERDRLTDWMNTDQIAIVRYGESIYAQPQTLMKEFEFIAERLPSIYSGVMAGQWIRDKFIPAPALALSPLVSEKVGREALDRENAIRFLQRQEMSIEPAKQGWQLATFDGLGLGWMNVLKNRINNYYPKEWRILKGQP